jgi:hypothetical protein
LTKVLFSHEQVAVFAPLNSKALLHGQVLAVINPMSVAESNAMCIKFTASLNCAINNLGAGMGEEEERSKKGAEMGANS